jgi:serine/threonine-protein kinase
VESAGLPFYPSTTVVFYVAVALVQAALATVLVARAWRRELAWVVGGLFMANAGGAAASALRNLPGGPGGTGNLLGAAAWTYFDQASFVLLAYLALAFPARPRLLQRRAWVLPTAMGAWLAVVLALVALHTGVLENARNVVYPLTPTRLVVGYVLPNAVWATLLLRWTLRWRGIPTALRPQAQLVMAAFLVRAAGQIVGTLAVPAQPGPASLLLAAQACNVAALLTLFGCILWLANAQRRQAGAPRRQTFLLLGFLVAGLVVGSLSSAVSRSYLANAWSHLDLYVVRPTLIWLAMTRHQFLGIQWRSGRPGLALLWLLAFAAASAIISPAVAGPFPGLAYFAAFLATAAVVATALLAVASPWLLAPDSAGAGLQSYRAALSEAFRNGPPAPRELEALERLREWHSLGPGQHQGMLAAVAAPQAAWTAGTTALGRYRIERLLGEGTTGEAYWAHDALLDRPVVLKRTRKLDPLRRRALLREGEAMGRLRHPRIVQLLATEFLGDEPVLVLEAMAGGSLQGLLADGPLPPERATAIALDVLEALEPLHAAGWVHGDVKPANVLLDGEGRAKLADFGIARPAPAAPLGDPTLEAPAGTLRYMAPEQVRGGPADARADLYALAVVLAEALGSHPVPQALTDLEARNAIARGPGAALPGVPRALREAVARGLEPDPARRFASAQAFAAALAATRRGTPASSGPRPPRRRSPAGTPGPSAAAPS